MKRPTIYLVQFATGSSINLIPLAAGQLISRLKIEHELLKKYDIGEIIFMREPPEECVHKMQNVVIIGFSTFLWNKEISLMTARKVKKRFPGALIVFGGPAVPKDLGMAERFLEKHPFIEIIVKGDGEEVFAEICKHHSRGEDFSEIPGIVYRERRTGEIRHTAKEAMLSLENLPSPYLDGTFDEFLDKQGANISGMIWESNRGCPFRCGYCTWGNLAFNKIREKSIEVVKKEIEWMGKRKVKYIAMTDANFGIKERDVKIAHLFAETRRKFGGPEFISVSWLKNSSDMVLKITEIFRKAGIGCRVTLSLQSLTEDALKAVNRDNIKHSAYNEIRDSYKNRQVYSYTELIMSLPLETYDSFLHSVEECLSTSIFNYLQIYPTYLFPNTSLEREREKYGMETVLMEGLYTKSIPTCGIKEYVETVIGTSTMSREQWVDTFVVSNYTVALYDNRLAFFILGYLKKIYDVKITDFVACSRNIVAEEKFPVIYRSIMEVEQVAQNIQRNGNSHIMKPKHFGKIPFDPPDAIFLDLLMQRMDFYAELLSLIELYLNSKNIVFDKEILEDLFIFQNAVMAHPDGPVDKNFILRYNWYDYFLYAFMMGENKLTPTRKVLKVIDPRPSNGDLEKFLVNHFGIRGVPPFNNIANEDGDLVFPPLDLRAGKADCEYSA